MRLSIGIGREMQGIDRLWVDRDGPGDEETGNRSWIGGIREELLDFRKGW